MCIRDRPCTAPSQTSPVPVINVDVPPTDDTSTSPPPVFAFNDESMVPSRTVPAPELTFTSPVARSAETVPVPVFRSSRPAPPVTMTSAAPVRDVTCDPTGAVTTTESGTARKGSAFDDSTRKRLPSSSTRASRTASSGPA